jgi:hypothetical protein
MSSTYYRPSGRFPAKNLFYALAYSTAAIPLAWLYVWLTLNIPFIYVNFFIAAGFAIVLGMIANLTASSGKARNPLFMGLLGFAIGFFGWYCQWVLWSAKVAIDFSIPVAGNNQIPSVLEFARHPGLVFLLAQMVYETGIWKIKGASLEGFWLLVAWVIEFAMMAGFPLLMGVLKAKTPFCESSLTWAEAEELPKRFGYLSDKEKFLKAVESSSGGLLAFLPEYADDEPAYSHVTLYRCKGSNESFVTVTNTKVRIENNKEKKSRETVAEYLAVPRLTADDIASHCASGNPPELESAIAALEKEKFVVALELALPYINASDSKLRADANRLCALANSRLNRWEAAFGQWLALFEVEPGAHNALQLASTSVMAGDVPRGEEWIAKAMQLNESTREISLVTIHTNFLTALKSCGHMREAMPYLEWMKGLYEQLSITDPTFLAMRTVPFFPTFLDNSGPIVQTVMSPGEAHDWYASMLEYLDDEGKLTLTEWLTLNIKVA